MTRKELTAYRDRLEAMELDLRGTALLHEHAIRAGERADEGEADTALDAPAPGAADIEVESAVLATEEGLLSEVVAALGRIDAGAFGRCGACGRAISRKRLEAVPYARDCIRCARVAEAAPSA